MVHNQGVMKSPVIDITVLETLIEELVLTVYPNRPKSLTRDLTALRSRLHCEGLGFLTNTMPALAGCVDASFGSRVFALNPDLGFAPKKGWKTPAFLQCFFSRVYAEDGRLLSDACRTSLFALRQILNLFKKVERPVGAWCRKAIQGFVERAQEPRPFNRWSDLRFQAAQLLVKEVLSDFDVTVIKGKHGPGVVADRLTNGEKWDHSLFSDAANWFWPREEYFSPPGYSEDGVGKRGRVGHIPARLICVPKTSKTPRLIAAEPSGHQFLQGGLAEKLVRTLESHWLTAGHVNFTDQTINQRLAVEGSRTNEWSTIDLSDASDTLGHELVQALFPREVGLALDILRSDEVAIDEDRKISPTFYAVMGSALTFPVESLVFYCLSVGAVLGSLRRDGAGVVTRSVSSGDEPHTLDDGARIHLQKRIDYCQARDCVYVYGDDIVVRREHAEAVLNALQDFGFKPNLKKSYIEGPFRESCGVDSYMGTDVRPIYIRKYTPRSRSDYGRIVSNLETANQMADLGLVRTADVLWKSLGVKLPVGDSSASYLCRRNLTSLPSLQENRRLGYKVRWHKGLQTHQIRASFVQPKKCVDDPSAVGRYFAALTGRVTAQSSSLTRGTGILEKKTRWMQLR